MVISNYHLHSSSFQIGKSSEADMGLIKNSKRLHHLLSLWNAKSSVCSVEEKCISLQFPGLSQWISSFDFRLPLIHIASVIPNGHWLTLQYHYLLLCLNRPFCVFVSEIRWFPWLFCTNGLFMCQDDENEPEDERFPSFRIKPVTIEVLQYIACMHYLQNEPKLWFSSSFSSWHMNRL